MGLEAGIYSYLSGKAAIIALVSTRIYPVMPPQQGTVFPCIIFTRVSSRRIHTMNGSAILCYARVQFDCFATTYLAANSLNDTLRVWMDGFSGTFGSTTIQSCFLESDADYVDPEPGAEQDRIYGVRSDYTIAYTESSPSV